MKHLLFGFSFGFILLLIQTSLSSFLAYRHRVKISLMFTATPIRTRRIPDFIKTWKKFIIPILLFLWLLFSVSSSYKFWMVFYFNWDGCGKIELNRKFLSVWLSSKSNRKKGKHVWIWFNVWFCVSFVYKPRNLFDLFFFHETTKSEDSKYHGQFLIGWERQKPTATTQSHFVIYFFPMPI